MISGVSIPYLALSILYIMTGHYNEFLLWTIGYPADYLSQIQASQFTSKLVPQAEYVFSTMTAIWMLSCVGLLFTIGNVRHMPAVQIILLYAVFSFLSITPGFYFGPHYFLLLTPVAALLAGYGLDQIRIIAGNLGTEIAEKGVPILVFLIAVFLSLNQQRDYLFKMNSAEVSRSVFGMNPFYESIAISKYINDRSTPNDEIAVIGSEPQIYFYAQRRAATGFLYMYPLMERHDNSLKMQKQLSLEIEKHMPLFLVFVKYPYSWLQRPDSNVYVFKWADSYIKKYYHMSAIVELSKNGPVYVDKVDAEYRIGNPYWVAIYKRNDY